MKVTACSYVTIEWNWKDCNSRPRISQQIETWLLIMFKVMVLVLPYTAYADYDIFHFIPGIVRSYRLPSVSTQLDLM
jgi:hypothetical protein